MTVVPRIIILVTGENLGGKGKFIDILEKDYGFTKDSNSDTLRKIAGITIPPMPLDPNTLANIADILRYGMGPDGVARVTLRDMDTFSEKMVIDSIRHPAEAEYTKTYFRVKFPWQNVKTILVAVRANDEIKVERGKGREREGDPQTREEYQKRDERDMKNLHDYQQQVAACIEIADYTIWNNTNDEGDLRRETEKFLLKIGEGIEKGKERK